MWFVGIGNGWFDSFVCWVVWDGLGDYEFVY